MFPRVSAAAWMVLALVGCAHVETAPSANNYGPPPGEARFAQGAPPPGWINKLPNDKSALYAVGISGPTYYPDDAMKYAGDNARVELGRAISSHITSAFLSVTTDSGTYADQASNVDATSDDSDAIVENSEIVATWIDRSGSYSGTAGTVYALARIDLNKAKAAAPKPAPTAANPPTP